MCVGIDKYWRESVLGYIRYCIDRVKFEWSTIHALSTVLYVKARVLSSFLLNELSLQPITPQFYHYHSETTNSRTNPRHVQVLRAVEDGLNEGTQLKDVSGWWWLRFASGNANLLSFVIG